MLKSILNLSGIHSLSKKEQKMINGGFSNSGVPIASSCDYRSFQSCANSCTAPGTECHPCADNNATAGTFECRFVGITIG